MALETTLKKEKKPMQIVNIGLICQGYHKQKHPHHCTLYDKNSDLNCKYIEIKGIHRNGYCLYKKP